MKQNIKKIVMTIVFALGLFAGAFANPNATTTAQAETITGIVYYKEISTSTLEDLRRVYPSDIDNFTNYENVGKKGDATYTEYKYVLVGDTGLTITGTATAHNREHAYQVEKRTYTLLSTEKKWYGTKYNYDDPTPEIVEEGKIISKFYSEITVNIDRGILSDDKDTTPVVSGAQLMSNGKYKVYITDTATFTMPEFEGFKVKVGDVFTNTFAMTGASNSSVNVSYMLNTDNTIKLDSATIDALNKDLIKSINVNGTELTKNNSELIVAENTLLTIVAQPNNKYLVTSVAVNYDRFFSTSDNNTSFTVTLNTESTSTYVISVNTENLFSSIANNIVINKQDINLMMQGNADSKDIVYNAIWNNAFQTNSNIQLGDVEFEYYAGKYTINFSQIHEWLSFLGSKDIDFYYPINSQIVRTKVQFCDYVSNYLGNTVSSDTLQKYLSDDFVSTMLSTLHDFGSQDTETIRLVFEGNDVYGAVKVTSTIGCLDLRENITLDLNENIEVVFGSYASDADILNLLLANRNGVVAENGDIVSDLNSELTLSASLVGKDVGSYQVNVMFPLDNYFYKTASKLVNVTITKA